MADKGKKTLTYWLFAAPALFVVLLLGFKFSFGEPYGQAAIESLIASAVVLAASLVVETLRRRSRR